MISEERTSWLAHLAGFLEASFDLPKTAKVPLNALIFWLHVHVPLKQRKNKIFIEDSFFSIFDLAAGGSNGDPGGVTAGGYKKKVDKKFLQINTNNFPSLGQA